MSSPDRLPVTFSLEPMTFKISKVPFLITFGLAVILAFDLLNSTSNQFIFVPKCTYVVNLIKFPE